MKDFFVSYNGKDKAWAEWIAWQLEEAGFSTVVQAWDFRPGGNFVLDMQRAAAESDRTIAVLSQNYLAAMYTQPEWAAAFAQDPTGANKTLLPVRVQECELKGLLSQIVYIDLVGKAQDEARELLLAGLQTGRAKPGAAPGFPGSAGGAPAAPRPATPPPTFPVAGAWGEQNLSPAERESILQVKQTQIGGVNLSNISGSTINIGNIAANVTAGGDVVGGDKITTTAAPDSPQAQLTAALAQWQQQVEAILSRLDDEDEREFGQKTVAKAVDEAQKGETADPVKIETWLDKLSNMAPDILEVTATTLQNSFAGVGLVLRKINDRIKLERAG
ncbi:MAG: hypothetical protein Kow0031_38770 [Anaerolineae bacterium]